MVSRKSTGIIYLPQYIEDRGSLVVCEQNLHVPFDIKRVFWILDVPENESRAGHSHKNCEQLLVAVSGSFVVTAKHKDVTDVYLMSDPHDGLYIPTGVYIKLDNFSADAVCLVLCSEYYKKEDNVNV